VLGEDVEDQRGAVDDLDLDDVLEGAALARGELGVTDDRVGALGDDDVAQLGGLALAEVGRGVGLAAPLDQAGEHLGPGRLGEGGQLAHRVLGVLGGALGPHRGQDDPLEAQLAVLDLGDVLEFGGQPADATQRGALLAVELVAVEPRSSSRTKPVSSKVVSSARASARPEMLGPVIVLPGSRRATPCGRTALPRGASRGPAMTENDHYFTAEPASADERRRVRSPCRAPGVVEVAPGIFSPGGLDKGTAVLLDERPPPATG
jgi:hypothetical protein